MERDDTYFMMRSQAESEAAERARSAQAKKRHLELAKFYEERAQAYGWNEHRR